MEETKYFSGDFESSFFTDHYLDIKTPEVSLHHIKFTGLKRITNGSKIQEFEGFTKTSSCFLEGDFLGECQYYSSQSNIDSFNETFNKYILNNIQIKELRKIGGIYHGRLTGSIVVQLGGLIHQKQDRKLKNPNIKRKPDQFEKTELHKREGCAPSGVTNVFGVNKSALTGNRGCSPLGGGLSTMPLAGGCSPVGGGCSPVGAGCSPLGGGCSPVGAGCSPLGGGCSPVGAGCSPLGGGCLRLLSSILSLFFLLWILTFLFKSCEAFLPSENDDVREQKDSEGTDDQEQGLKDDEIDYDAYLDEIIKDTLSGDIEENDFDNSESLIQDDNELIPTEQSDRNEDSTEIEILESDSLIEDSIFLDSTLVDSVIIDSVTIDGVLKELPFIEFLTNSMELKPSSFEGLDKLAEFLLVNRQFVTIVYGHTDNVGSAAHNLALSKERAQAVVYYLHKSGVELSRLKAIGRGEMYPKTSNKTESGRAKNRRVEVRIKKKA